jgi:hypothetical protein
MADSNHRSLWLPRWLWEQYGTIVGNVGRTGDLKVFMDWRIDHPDLVLGPDVDPPYDFLATLRIESDRWDMYLETVDDGAGSSGMRRYVSWRVQHPSKPLPGRRLGPLRRESPRPALV